MNIHNQIGSEQKQYCLVNTTGLGNSDGGVSAPRSGGTGFDPGPRHTKVVNNGTSCSPLGTRIFGVVLGLVATVSVQCDWGWYQVKVSWI